MYSQKFDGLIMIKSRSAYALLLKKEYSTAPITDSFTGIINFFVKQYYLFMYMLMFSES